MANIGLGNLFYTVSIDRTTLEQVKKEVRNISNEIEKATQSAKKDPGESEFKKLREELRLLSIEATELEQKFRAKKIGLVEYKREAASLSRSVNDLEKQFRGLADDLDGSEASLKDYRMGLRDVAILQAQLVSRTEKLGNEFKSADLAIVDVDNSIKLLATNLKTIFTRQDVTDPADFKAALTAVQAEATALASDVEILGTELDQTTRGARQSAEMMQKLEAIQKRIRAAFTDSSQAVDVNAERLKRYGLVSKEIADRVQELNNLHKSGAIDDSRRSSEMANLEKRIAGLQSVIQKYKSQLIATQEGATALQRVQTSLSASMKKIGEAATTATKAYTGLDARFEQITASSESINRQMRTLNELFARGDISSQKYGRQLQVLDSLLKQNLASQQAYSSRLANTAEAEKKFQVAIGKTTMAMKNNRIAQERLTGGLSQMRLQQQLSLGATTLLNDRIFQLSPALGILTNQLIFTSQSLKAFVLAAAPVVAIAGSIIALAATMTASARSGIELESALANVRKTTNFTNTELKDLVNTFQDLSSELPVTVSEFLEISRVAGQLGITGRKNIEQFAEAVAKVAIATDVVGEEGATSLARFLQATGTEMEKMGLEANRVGNILNELENTTASTAREILNMTSYTAGLASQSGATRDQILAINASLLSLGVQAEAGGSAVVRIMSKIQVAASEGGSELEAFARVSGMTSEEFKTLADNSPVDALEVLAQAMNESSKQGLNLNNTLIELGIREVRERRALLALAQGADVLSGALANARRESFLMQSLNEEVAIQVETVANKFILLGNRFREIAIDIGVSLLPSIHALVNTLIVLADNLDIVLANLVAIGLYLGRGLIVKGITGITTAIAAAGGVVAALKALGVALLGFLGPLGIFALIVTGATAAALAMRGFGRNTKEASVDIEPFLETMQQIEDAFSRVEDADDLLLAIESVSTLLEGNAKTAWENYALGITNSIDEVTNLQDEIIKAIRLSAELASQPFRDQFTSSFVEAQRLTRGLPRVVSQPPIEPGFSVQNLPQVLERVRAARDVASPQEVRYLNELIEELEISISSRQAIIDAAQEAENAIQSIMDRFEADRNQQDEERRRRQEEEDRARLEEQIFWRIKYYESRLEAEELAAQEEQDLQQRLLFWRQQYYNSRLEADEIAAEEAAALAEKIAEESAAISERIAQEEQEKLERDLFWRQLYYNSRLEADRLAAEEEQEQLEKQLLWRQQYYDSRLESDRLVAEEEQQQLEQQLLWRQQYYDSLIESDRLAAEKEQEQLEKQLFWRQQYYDSLLEAEAIAAQEEQEQLEKQLFWRQQYYNSRLEADRLAAEEEQEQLEEQLFWRQQYYQSLLDAQEIARKEEEERLQQQLLWRQQYYDSLLESERIKAAEEEEELERQLFWRQQYYDSRLEADRLAAEEEQRQLDKQLLWRQQYYDSLAEAERIRIDSTPLAKLADMLESIGDTLGGSLGQIAKASAEVTDAFNKMRESGGKWSDELKNGTNGVLSSISGLANAIGSALPEQESFANKAVEGFYAVGGAIVTVITGSKELGQVVSAMGKVVSRSLGDMANGLKQIREQIKGTIENATVLSKSTIEAFAKAATELKSRGGVLGFLGFKKSVLNEQFFQAMLDTATSIANGISSAMQSAVQQALSGDQNWKTDFRKNMTKAITDLMIQAMIEAAITRGVIQNFIEEFTKLLFDDEGNITQATIDEAARYAEKNLEGTVKQAEYIVKKVVGSLPDEFRSAYEETAQLSEEFVNELKGKFTKTFVLDLDWWKVVFSKTDMEGFENALNIAETVANGFADGFKQGLRDAISGNQDWKANLRESLTETLMGIVMDSFLQTVILEGIFGEFMMGFSERLAKGNIESALEYMAQTLPGVISDAESIIQGFIDSLPPELQPGGEFGPEPSGRGSGASISEITGPTRDLLLDLLRPLSILPSWTQMIQDIRNDVRAMRIASVGDIQPASLMTPVGAPNLSSVSTSGTVINLSNVTITTSADNVQALSRDVSRYASRQKRGGK